MPLNILNGTIPKRTSVATLLIAGLMIVPSSTIASIGINAV